MATLPQIFEWFRTGKNPTEPEFKDTFQSFWHKSEKIPQTQVFGLENSLNNISVGMIYKPPVADVADLTTTYPAPVKGWSVKVQSTGYIYQYDGTDWNDTGLTAYPGNVATQEDVTQLDRKISIINVDIDYPLPDGYYTIEMARGAVPTSKRRSNNILIFKESENNTVIWFFSGISTTAVTYWNNGIYWRKLTEKKYHDLAYGGSANNTRIKVSLSERTSGMIIHYMTDLSESVYELYTGDSYINGDGYWNSFVRINTYDQLMTLLQYYAAPVYATGRYSESIKELYIEKYEAGASYKITRLANTDIYKGLIWIQKIGDAGYAVQINNTDMNGIVTLSSGDGTFVAHFVMDWSKIPYGFNETVDITIRDACKNIEYSPGIMTKIRAIPGALAANALHGKLYSKTESVVHEDPTEATGNAWYKYNNTGLVYRAAETVEFDSLIATLNIGDSGGSLIVKYGGAVNANGGTIAFESDNFILPESGRVTITLNTKVTLYAGQYVWIYYTGSTNMRVWLTDNDGNTRCGMYFQGNINTYRYSTDITLFTKKGDIVDLYERLGDTGDKRTAPLLTLPDRLYVVAGREQRFYYNQFIYGIESSHDNTLLNCRCEIKGPSNTVLGSNKSLCANDCFAIHTKTAGSYPMTLNVYDQYMNPVAQKFFTVCVKAIPTLSQKSILMLGDSWTDINNLDRGYTSYLNKALKELGITMNFIGTRDAGTSGLKHEGIGGYSWPSFAGPGSPLWNDTAGSLDFTWYRTVKCGLSAPLDYCNIQLGVNDCLSGNLTTTKEGWAPNLAAVTTLLDLILADSPNCKIIVNLSGLDAPTNTGWGILYGVGSQKTIFQLNSYYLRTYINELITARDDYDVNVFTGQSILGVNRWFGYGYTDRRYRYFKVNLDEMTEGDINKMKNFNYPNDSPFLYTTDGKEFQAYNYDERGYLVCVAPQGFSAWASHNQEFINDASIPVNDVPAAGSLSKKSFSTADFPVVPYTECLIENNELNSHYFMNATHPYDLGYRQMAYCLAHQLALI
jgi:hypothetical protein